MILDAVLRTRRPSEQQLPLERQQFEPGEPGSLLASFFGARTDSGITVTVAGSLALPAVYAAVRILSDAVGTLPLHTYRDLDDGSRQKAKGEWQWTLLNRKPNVEMTAPLVWSTTTAYCAGYGEAFLGKDFTPRPGFPLGAVTGLWPVHPERVDVARENGRKVYWLKDATGVRTGRRYTDEQMLHIVGLTLDGMRGISPISAGRRAIAAGLSMVAYTDAFYGNAALPSGILTTEKELSDPAFERLSRRWRSTYGGRRNSGKVAILEQGMSFQPISVSQQDAQFVEVSQLTVADIARLFRVPMSRLEANPAGGSLTYRTVEADDRYFATHSLRPWLVRIEEVLKNDPDLFPDPDALYCEFLLDALMRASTKDRFDAYAVATAGKPWMRPSEVRQLENQPVDDEIDEWAQPPAPAAPAPAGPAADDEEQEGEMEEQRLPARRGLRELVTPSIQMPTPQITVQVPEQPAPVIQVDVHVPDAAPPAVTVDVHVPEQPAPVVEITNEVTVEERAPAERELVLERDANGRVKGGRVR